MKRWASVLFMVLILGSFCGCGRELTEDEKKMIDTLVSECDKWEKDYLWTMQFVGDKDGTVELFYIWCETPLSDSVKSREYWYSTTSPITCVGKSDYTIRTIYNGERQFTPCWNTEWTEAKKRQVLTEKYYDFIEDQ